MSISRTAITPAFNVVNTSLPNANSDFTIMVWVKTDAVNLPILCFARETSPYFASFVLRITNSKCAIFSYIKNDNGATPSAETLSNTNGTDVTSGQWNHFALKKEGLTLTGYLNGVSAVSITNTTYLTLPFTFFRLGRNHATVSIPSSGVVSPSGAYKRMAHLRRFSQALTVTEIESEMNSCSFLHSSAVCAIEMRNRRMEVNAGYCSVVGGSSQRVLEDSSSLSSLGLTSSTIASSDNPLQNCWPVFEPASMQNDSVLAAYPQKTANAELSLFSDGAMPTTNPAFLRNANSSPKATSSLSANAELDVFGGESEGTSVCDAENF